MKFSKSPIALAAFALMAGTPLAAHAISVSFQAPASGATLTNVTWNQTSACQVSGSDIRRVVFSLISSSGRVTALNTESSSPWQCNLTSRNFADGNYTLRAVAYDSANRSATANRSITIKNNTTTTPTTPTTPTDAKPTVTFTAPLAGGTISSPTTQTSRCQVTAKDDKGIKQVQFFLDGTALNTELSSPYQCNIDNRKFTNGAHVLKAVATDTANQTTSAEITVNITGGLASGGTTNTPPTVGITSPVAGAKVAAGTPYAATASDTGGSVAKVDVYLTSGTTQKLVDSKTAAPYSGTLNTTGLPNGTATLMAVATDNLGATSSVQRSVTIDNTVVSNPGPTPDPDPGTGGGSPTTLPSTNARAVPTFESLGMYWKPGSNPGASGCSLRYRKTTDSAWKEGFPMWYDSRDGECRGSIVHLEPGADYAVEMGINGSFTAGVNTKTWSENFPIGQTIQVQSGSQPLKITQGGTKDAYVLYTGPATIDVANAVDHGVEISARYVIVRGLTVKGAKRHGIRLLPGASDVVIEDNEVTNWGSWSGKTLGGVQVQTERDSAIRADCRASPFLERTVIQRNKLHTPRYGANSWDYGHPLGAQAITYSFCGGNHVFRYNDVYSVEGKYFKDGFGGEDNFSATGFPVADTDIYGNRVSHTWDDGIEIEGGNKNVRVWGNYIDQTAIGIASTVVHHGPLYIFRNVYNRSRKLSAVSLDSDDRLNFAKSGTQPDFGGGRRYVFHNTMLQATQAGLSFPLGAGGGLIAAGRESPLTNTMSRNNILHVWKSSWDSIRTQGGAGNDFNYDLRNGGISAYAGAEANGMVGTPIYASGNGWQSWGNGMYQLAPSSPGYDKGQRLPNFNDGFTGAGPDVGAHEAGTPAMKLGVSGASAQWSGPGTSTATSTTGTGGTTTSSNEVCSTALCVAGQ